MTNPLYDALYAPNRSSDRIFLHLDHGKTVTFSEFGMIADQLASVLVSRGILPGDRVALQIEKSPEALALIAACIKTGVIFLPLNTAYTVAEVSYFVGDAEPKLLVCDESARVALVAALADSTLSVMTLNANGTGELLDAAATVAGSVPVADLPAADLQQDALAALLYTSGTTGRSKGAMLTHGNLLSNARALADLWEFSESDVLLHALPIFHTHGLFVATNTVLLSGGSFRFMQKFNLDEVVGALPSATAMMGVPTFYTRLLADDRFDQELVKHMRLFVSGSAPMLEETHLEFNKRTGHSMLERYGMTETSMITSNPYSGERRVGTVGFPLPNIEVKVCDPNTGKTLGVGEIGILEVRGPNVFKGYWRMPEKTAEEIRKNGFFITGDLSIIDSDGYVKIVGRDKDLIISGGFNVYPKEVELLLDEHAGVLESAVVGVAHPDFGEAVVGVVVGKKGVTIVAEELLDSIADKLARFKQPKKIFVIDQLPRNTMGKVQKSTLREQYNATFTT